MDIRIVDGHLTRDAEIKTNKGTGAKFLTFTIVNNGFMRGAQTTTYFNVISYNEHDMKRVDNLKKGRMIIVSGRPNESIGIKDNQTYLNRNIMAHSIDFASPTIVKSDTAIAKHEPEAHPQVNTSPVLVPTCEVARVAAPTVNAPTVEVPSITSPGQLQGQIKPQVTPQVTPVSITPPEVYQASTGNIPQIAEVDDLPF